MTTESIETKVIKKKMPTLSNISTLLALVIAVVALLVGGRLFYLNTQQRIETTALQDQLAQQQKQFEKINQELAQQTQTIAALTKTVGEISAQLNEGKQTDLLKRYRLGDIKHLLILANQALMFEYDPQKAVVLLSEANQNISTLNDATLTEVSVQIMSDSEALKAVKVVDVENIYTQLNTLIAQTDTLSVTPVLKFVPDDNSDKAQANASTVSNVLNWLGQYIKIRKQTQAVTPLLTPEESVYVKHNIVVLLEQAQWGLLRREPLAYKTSLERAEKLVQQYAVKTDSVTTALLESIAQLKAVDIAPALPDISKSVLLLEKVTATTSGSEP